MGTRQMSPTMEVVELDDGGARRARPAARRIAARLRAHEGRARAGAQGDEGERGKARGTDRPLRDVVRYGQEERPVGVTRSCPGYTGAGVARSGEIARGRLHGCAPGSLSARPAPPFLPRRRAQPDRQGRIAPIDLPPDVRAQDVPGRTKREKRAGLPFAIRSTWEANYACWLATHAGRGGAHRAGGSKAVGVKRAGVALVRRASVSPPQNCPTSSTRLGRAAEGARGD
jgi:hypothetical protein